jgi:hypothetical protein
MGVLIMASVKCIYSDENVTKARRRNTEKTSQRHLDAVTKARAIAQLFPARQRAEVVRLLMTTA